VEELLENLQMELINLQCYTNFNKKSSETKMYELYSYLPKDKFSQLRSLGLTMIAMFVSTYVCEKFFSLMKNNITKSRSRKRNSFLL
jgi:hypothetical protein